MPIQVKFLGQSSLRFEAASQVLYTDPYFSHQVEEMEGPEQKRQIPIPMLPQNIRDAHWVLISHGHLDHCDLKTLKPLSIASPQCRFIAPAEVAEHMIKMGMDPEKIQACQESWLSLAPGLKVHAIPAAHPSVDRDSKGRLKYCGYLLEAEGRRCYFAGDTSVHGEMLSALLKHLPIHSAFLPVNEKNFFKDQRGIIGNMTLREAFELCQLLKIEKLVPIHWDMFRLNSVFKEEIEVVYRLTKPAFRMEMDPQTC